MNHLLRALPSRRSRAQPRRGAAMLVCLAVVSIVTVMTVSILDTETLQWSALRNTTDYERALFLAGAGVHHALAEIEESPAWRTGISSTEFPAASGQYYSATAVDGSGDTVVVTGTGIAGGVTRKLQVTIIPGS